MPRRRLRNEPPPDLLGAVVAVLGLGAVVRVWTALENQAYHPPIYSTEQEPVPRDRGAGGHREGGEGRAKAKKYEPPAYRTFPFAPAASRSGSSPSCT